MEFSHIANDLTNGVYITTPLKRLYLRAQSLLISGCMKYWESDVPGFHEEKVLLT